MKKIISLIAAVAMMSTMFVATASAEVANATLKIVPTKLTDAEFVEIMAESIPDGYEAYTLDVSVAGLGELSVTNTGTAKRPVYSGRRINNFNLELDFDKLENVNTAYTCANETVLCETMELSSDTFDGKVYKFLFNAGSAAAAYPNTFGTTIAADADVESICN
ncbi:MAG: hypothetical protein PUB42_07685, partial [Firmicutes bacterium]|nr:hypothetical protein [Bacillota bacterium]